MYSKCEFVCFCLFVYIYIYICVCVCVCVYVCRRVCVCVSELLDSEAAQQKLWCKNYTTGVNRGPHHAFYTGVKFVVLVQHQVVLF